jgi:hypothetical protein
VLSLRLSSCPDNFPDVFAKHHYMLLVNREVRRCLSLSLSRNSSLLWVLKFLTVFQRYETAPNLNQLNSILFHYDAKQH